ncbi:DUF3499 domain-containing protein [uncultured Varibaculum sp.]|uniref:DUF3499 domain-containing protein n=1 Tax=uncultured Varibaculum sp. TaxID=413896 RepID=UPI002587DE78|nr:DUF3499 domain-containing protein [uncultured Varibaculum sp.]
MRVTRSCSKNGCNQVAAATLTYVYKDSTVVLGPLATQAEPHAYDLCAEHANNLTAPRGWQVVRLASEFTPAEPSDDDLEALANVVREASKRRHLSTAKVNKNWDGRLSPEATSGGRGHVGHEYDAGVKQGLPAGSRKAPEKRRGHLRLLPGGLPDPTGE